MEESKILNAKQLLNNIQFTVEKEIKEAKQLQHDEISNRIDSLQASIKLHCKLALSLPNDTQSDNSECAVMEYVLKMIIRVVLDAA